ncbi:hypothetical protein [Rhodanobacter sp. OR92]|uniref:site-specific integrase n=1 Tax=Rhodanobacter sp. OR92 TaxID=1076524 RepID=UPI00041E3C58|nr:hypothetical protein [Rhodanobacter sp. OR92]
MTRGRKRKFDPTIPKHIDQAGIPRGFYWDRTGNGRWYVRDPDEDGRMRAKRIAGPDARLSDLHTLAEARAGNAVGTLGYILDKFHDSAQFKNLSVGSHRDYNWCKSILKDRKLANGLTWVQLEHRRIDTALIQRLVDAIEREGTPAKANHVLRYMRLVFTWAVQRGHAKSNPARGVGQATERGQFKMPDHTAMAAVIAYARAGGALKPHTKGSCPPYLAPLMELAYLCRLRGIEAVRLTEAHATDEGVLASRVKGSRDNITRWIPRLRAAWAEALAVRAKILARKRNKSRPVPLRPEDRFIFLSEDGTPITKSAVDTAWQNLMRRVIADGTIAKEQRFTLHGQKHRGITDSTDKKSGGHKTEAMRQRYDHEVPLVDAPIQPELSGEFSGQKKTGTPDEP